METRLKAWSPYSRKDRRTCLQRCFKEDFKAVRISIEKVFCEISQLVIITRIRRPSYIHTAQNTCLQPCACNPYNLYGDQA